MGIKRRQYSKEQKEEIVQKLLSGKSALELGKENNISWTYQPLEKTILKWRTEW